MVPMKGGLPGNSFFSCLFLSLFCFGGRGSFPNHTEMALSEGAHTSEMAPSVSLRDALDSDNTTPPPERLAVLLTGQASIWLRRMTKRRQRASRTCLPHLLPPAQLSGEVLSPSVLLLSSPRPFGMSHLSGRHQDDSSLQWVVSGNQTNHALLCLPFAGH